MLRETLNFLGDLSGRQEYITLSDAIPSGGSARQLLTTPQHHTHTPILQESMSTPGELQISYLLTPWCRVLLEKLTGLEPVKKFPAFHGTRRSIIAFTNVRYLSLYWASPIQSIYPHPTSWRSILILSTHLRLGLPSGLLPSDFSSKTLYTPSPHPYVPHAQPISFFSILSLAQYWVRVQNLIQ